MFHLYYLEWWKLYTFLEDFSIFKFLIPDTHITPIFHLSETLISVQILLLNIIHTWTVYSIFTKKKEKNNTSLDEIFISIA